MAAVWYRLDVILTLFIVIKNGNRSIFNILNINGLLYAENEAGLVSCQLKNQSGTK